MKSVPCAVHFVGVRSERLQWGAGKGLPEPAGRPAAIRPSGLALQEARFEPQARLGGAEEGQPQPTPHSWAISWSQALHPWGCWARCVPYLGRKGATVPADHPPTEVRCQEV